MSESWEDFLDIIGLNKYIRQKANLKVLLKFPLGEPKKELLLNLFDYITKIYGSQRFTILWWFEESSPSPKATNNPHTKIISKDDLEFLHLLWERIAGDYILFLPEDFNFNKINVEDEEEFIGM